MNARYKAKLLYELNSVTVHGRAVTVNGNRRCIECARWELVEGPQKSPIFGYGGCNWCYTYYPHRRLALEL